MEIERAEHALPEQYSQKVSSAFVKFTEKEVMKMPKEFRKLIRLQGYKVYYRKRITGRYNCSYEIRYARKPYNKRPISASGTTLEEAKARFIEKLNEFIQQNNNAAIVPKDFNGFAMFWFENFHKRKVTEDTYNKALRRFEKYLKPAFGGMKVREIYSTLIQNLLDSISDRHRLEEDIHSLLNQIFTCAVKHGLIPLNPVGMVFHKNKDRKHGIAISKKDEKRLLANYENTPTKLVLAIMLYTGLRPCEYASAVIEEKFIFARNRKRKGGIIEYKRIAISPMLRPYLNGVTVPPRMSMSTLAKKIKAVLPKHKPYDMRTTFETRCDGCGIEDRVIGLFMGNDIGKDKKDKKLKKAYTDTNDPDYLEYLYQEGQKLNY